MTDYAITERMRVYGGGFVSALGQLWLKADEDNRARLKAAFPEYWAEYAALPVSAQDADVEESAFARAAALREPGD